LVFFYGFEVVNERVGLAIFFTLGSSGFGACLLLQSGFLLHLHYLFISTSGVNISTFIAEI
jgi:hypothetical protein